MESDRKFSYATLKDKFDRQSKNRINQESSYAKPREMSNAQSRTTR